MMKAAVDCEDRRRQYVSTIRKATCQLIAPHPIDAKQVNFKTAEEAAPRTLAVVVPLPPQPLTQEASLDQSIAHRESQSREPREANYLIVRLKAASVQTHAPDCVFHGIQ
jgi:hypothetical protein